MINFVFLVFFIAKNYVIYIEKTIGIIFLDYTKLLRNFLKTQFF